MFVCLLLNTLCIASLASLYAGLYGTITHSHQCVELGPPLLLLSTTLSSAFALGYYSLVRSSSDTFRNCDGQGVNKDA